MCVTSGLVAVTLPDGIGAEYLKFSNIKIHILLSLCFTLCLAHGYLPPAMIETTIVPNVKNKSGNLSDSSNYRPIALATIVSKCLSLFYYLSVQNIYLLLTIIISEQKMKFDDNEILLINILLETHTMGTTAIT